MPRSAVRRLRRERSAKLSDAVSASLEDGSYDSQAKSGSAKLPITFNTALKSIAQGNKIPLVVCVCMFLVLLLLRHMGLIGSH
jgi:hypothetical protein